MTAYRLTNLSVRNPSAGRDADLVLRGIDLTIWPGEQLAIVGPERAGKTALLTALACRLRPDAGELSAFGTLPWSLPAESRQALQARLFFVPQAASLLPVQRVSTAVMGERTIHHGWPRWAWLQALLSLAKPADSHPAFAVLKRFELQHHLHARLAHLSADQRQRCALVQMSMSSAETFLADEPLSQLDPAMAERTLAALQKQARMRMATLVCSLAQAELARASFPRLVGMRNGRIVFDAKRADVSDGMLASLYGDEQGDPGH